MISRISWQEAIGLLTRTLYTKGNRERFRQLLRSRSDTSLPLKIKGHTAFLEAGDQSVKLDQATLARMNDENPELSIDQVLQLINCLRLLIGKGMINTATETWSPYR